MREGENAHSAEEQSGAAGLWDEDDRSVVTACGVLRA